MRERIDWSVIAGICLGALVLAGARSRGALPVAVLAALVPPVLCGWWRSREALRLRYSRPLRLRWAEAPPFPPGEAWADLERELQELDYEPIGFMVWEEPEAFAGVFRHRSLPAYAFLTARCGRDGAVRLALHLESFLPEGGRLTTAAAAGYRRFEAAIPNGAPRLLQVRAWGPATPRALDGQHVGTLKAWVAGGRRFLPASRDALPEYLEADHARTAERLRRVGWLPPGVYLRALLGLGREVLRF